MPEKPPIVIWLVTLAEIVAFGVFVVALVLGLWVLAAVLAVVFAAFLLTDLRLRGRRGMR